MEGEEDALLGWHHLVAEFNKRQMAGQPCDLIVRLMLATRQGNLTVTLRKTNERA
jgi:hypothetical protein